MALNTYPPDKSHLQKVLEVVYDTLKTPLCEKYEKGRRYHQRPYLEFEMPEMPHKVIEFVKADQPRFEVVQTIAGSTAYQDTYRVFVPFDIERKEDGTYVAKNPL